MKILPKYLLRYINLRSYLVLRLSASDIPEAKTVKRPHLKRSLETAIWVV